MIPAYGYWRGFADESLLRRIIYTSAFLIDLFCAIPKCREVARSTAQSPATDVPRTEDVPEDEVSRIQIPRQTLYAHNRPIRPPLSVEPIHRERGMTHCLISVI